MLPLTARLAVFERAVSEVRRVGVQARVQIWAQLQEEAEAGSNTRLRCKIWAQLYDAACRKSKRCTTQNGAATHARAQCNVTASLRCAAPG